MSAFSSSSSSSLPAPLFGASGVPSPLGAAPTAVALGGGSPPPMWGGPPAPPAATGRAPLSLWRAIRRRWPLILALVALAVGGAMGYIKTVTPRFEAMGSLRLQTAGSPLAGGLELTGLLGGKDEIGTEVEVLRSRRLAEEVIDTLGLRVRTTPERLVAPVLGLRGIDSTARSGAYVLTRAAGGRVTLAHEPTSRTATGQAGLPTTLLGLTLAVPTGSDTTISFTLVSKAAAIGSLQQRVKIARAGRDASLLRVRIESADPAYGTAVVDQLMTTYLVNRVRGQKRTSSSSVSFITQQMETLSTELRAVEDSLRQFQEATGTIAPDVQVGAGISALAFADQQLSGVRAEREALERLLRERTTGARAPGAASPWRDVLAFPTIFRNPTAAQLLTTLVESDQRLSELLTRRQMADPDVQAADSRVRDIENQAQRLVESYVAGLRAQEQATQGVRSGPAAKLAAAPAQQMTYTRLMRQNKVLSDAYIMLQGELKKSEIAQAVDDSDAQIVDAAAFNPVPVYPRKLPLLVLGLLIGLSTGLGLAVWMESRDTTIRSRAQVREVTTMPIIGFVPNLAGKDRKVRSREESLVTIHTPRAASTEAYRILRTQLQHAHLPQGGQLKLLMFSSPTPGDGKTTTAANIAVTFAMTGKRVLLVDGDLRRGTLNEVVGCIQRPGVTEVLGEQVEMEQAIQRVELGGEKVLHVMASGTTSAAAAELVGGAAFADLLDRLTADFDLVIVDTPPLNLVTDAAILGTKVDGAVVVIRAGKSEQGELAFALDQLQAVRAPLLGIILNDYNPVDESTYGGSYGYGYGNYGGYGYTGAAYGAEDEGEAPVKSSRTKS